MKPRQVLTENFASKVLLWGGYRFKAYPLRRLHMRQIERKGRNSRPKRNRVINVLTVKKNGYILNI